MSSKPSKKAPAKKKLLPSMRSPARRSPCVKKSATRAGVKLVVPSDAAEGASITHKVVTETYQTYKTKTGETVTNSFKTEKTVNVSPRK